MNEDVAVIIKATPEVAEAFRKIFPDAVIRKLKPKEPAPEQKQETKPATVEEREKLLREIVTFCRERKSPVDAVRFFNYYDGRGWVDAAGKNITDWKAKLIEWETNGKNNKRSYTTAAEAELARKCPTEEEKKQFRESIAWMDKYLASGGEKKE